MRKLNQRERILGIATATVLAVGAVWSELVEPTWDRWSQQDEERFVLEQAVARDRALRAELSAIGAERRELDTNLRPPESTGLVPWFIEHVRDVASQTKFAPTSLRYLRMDPVGTAASYAELRFELRARATTEELQAFLVRLAASKRHVRVVALSVAPRKNSNSIEVDMTLAALAPGDVLPRKDER